MWQQAINDALGITARNLERFGDRFPHVSDGSNKYVLNDNTDWTDGFWSGILWLCYEYTGDKQYREGAVRTVASFRDRLAQFANLDHHDIGFLYSLSAKAQWIVEKDESARKLALEAADVLMRRWREDAGIIQAWGPKGDPDNGGRIIIDCLLNLPLLLWAGEQTGDSEYRRVAEAHALKSRRFLVRGDDSSYHTFYFDPANGNAIRGGTHQGDTDGSTWTRGQAWGIYGFALNSRYLGNADLLETAKRMARHFLARVPEDGVVYWDFEVPQEPSSYRDSSASAITACGLLEIASQLDESDPERQRFIDAATATVSALRDGYAERDDGESEGLIRRGSYHVRGGISPDDYTIWGDYYYLEALLRLERGVTGYWYERGR